MAKDSYGSGAVAQEQNCGMVNTTIACLTRCGKAATSKQAQQTFLSQQAWKIRRREKTRDMPRNIRPGTTCNPNQLISRTNNIEMFFRRHGPHLKGVEVLHLSSAFITMQSRSRSPLGFCVPPHSNPPRVRTFGYCKNLSRVASLGFCKVELFLDFSIKNLAISSSVFCWRCAVCVLFPNQFKNVLLFFLAPECLFLNPASFDAKLHQSAITEASLQPILRPDASPTLSLCHRSTDLRSGIA